MAENSDGDASFSKQAQSDVGVFFQTHRSPKALDLQATCLTFCAFCLRKRIQSHYTTYMEFSRIAAEGWHMNLYTRG